VKPQRISRLAGVATVVALSAVAVFVGLTRSAGAAAAAAPKNTSPPTISGIAQEGSMLIAGPGTWSGSTPMSFAYQWLRCNSNGASCKKINGATGSTYTLVGGDVGHRMRVAVTATNSDGSATAHSNPTDIVQNASKQAPKNTKEPFITGTAQQGQTLTANPGNWSGAQPMQFAYRWRRCDAKGNACANTGVTAQTYLLGSADVGRTLRVHVTAKNAFGSASALSNATAVVTASSQCQSIATVSLPDRLLVDRISYTPRTISSRSVPLVARFHVVTTKGTCVSGAIVQGMGVPFNRLSHEAEVTTDATGWAHITFQILPTFQLRPGNLVVIFVRARKPGENVLAGVSTRRLVSVRVA
jgi:hypothetical protein